MRNVNLLIQCSVPEIVVWVLAPPNSSCVTSSFVTDWNTPHQGDSKLTHNKHITCTQQQTHNKIITTNTQQYNNNKQNYNKNKHTTTNNNKHTAINKQLYNNKHNNLWAKKQQQWMLQANAKKSLEQKWYCRYCFYSISTNFVLFVYRSVTGSRLL